MSGLRKSQSHHNVNLWIVPLKMSLAALLLFAITMTPDMLAAYHVIHLPNWFTMGGIDDARAILGAMLGCVSTVLALIFSVALLVLSMVANLFGPRLLYRFVQDWVTQATIGLFMGAFIYVFLVFLVTHQDMHSSFIPQVSLITSWFVVLAAFGFLVFYSHRVAMLIQNPDAVGRIVDDIRRAVDRAYPSNGAQHPSATASHTLPPKMTDSMIVQSATSGYMQEINHQLLLDAANKNHVQIEIHFRPGQFVLEGEPLASISPPSQHGSLVVTLHSNAGKCALGSRYCTQFPEFAELFVLKSRTESDARKKDSVIFVLISRTNFSRNFGVHPSDGTVEMGTDYHQLLFDGQ